MISVRPATLRDIAAVDEVLARSYRALLRADYPPSVLVLALPRMTRAQPALLASGHYFVAAAEGRLLGAGGWSRAPPGRGRPTPGLGHVRQMATEAASTRRGVGRAVMAAVTEDATRHGMRALACVSTLTAVPFYRALGFREEGPIVLDFGGLSFPAVAMRRPL
jgi:GNAT superfamily N-acetyltransferase